MACEHDWIGASDNDLSRGLGITDLTDLESLDRAKVKATLLSQLFYSAMDTLTVCHFIWGRERSTHTTSCALSCAT